MNLKGGGGGGVIKMHNIALCLWEKKNHPCFTEINFLNRPPNLRLFFSENVFVSFFYISNYSLHLKELFTDFNGGPRNRLFFETIYGLYGVAEDGPPVTVRARLDHAITP